MPESNQSTMMASDILKAAFEKSSEGIIITIPSGEIFFCNTQAAQILHIPCGRCENLCEYLSLSFPINDSGSYEFNLGNDLISIRVEPYHKDGQNIRILYVNDLTEEKERREFTQMLVKISDAVSDGLIACNKQGEVILYNHQMENIEGIPRKEVMGKHYFDVWGMSPDESSFHNVFKTGKPRMDEVYNFLSSTGKECNYVYSTFPLKRDKEVTGIYCISRDYFRIRKLMERTYFFQEKTLSNGKRCQNGTRFCFSDIIGKSPEVCIAIKQAQKAAQNTTPVMVYGETGTGKEVFIQSIHNAGSYFQKPFLAVNCAAIPETLLEGILFGTTAGAYTGAKNTPGLFEQAQKGTLYLDEINSMPLMMQAKILRVLQEKTVRRIGASEEVPIHCRIISSVNEAPEECIRKGTFRQDLYYRLAGIYLEIPPLRDRPGDIKLLAIYFLKKYADLYGIQAEKISKDLLAYFNTLAWPGNVRELEHVIESAIAMMEVDDKELKVLTCPAYIKKGFMKAEGPRENLYELGTFCDLKIIERNTIIRTLRHYNWNISRTAKALGITRQCLQHKLRRMEISKNDRLEVQDEWHGANIVAPVAKNHLSLR